MRNQEIEHARKAEATEFKVWFNSVWLESGGLIQPKIASKLLGVSPARIPQIIKQNNLKTYGHEQLGNRYLLSLTEIMEIISKRAKRL